MSRFHACSVALPRQRFSCVLFLLSLLLPAPLLAGTFYAETYGAAVDMSAYSKESGYTGLYIGREPWLIMNGVGDNRSVSDDSPGISGQLLASLSVNSGAMQVAVDTQNGQVTAEAEQVTLNLNAGYKQSFKLEAAYVQSSAQTATTCGVIQPRTYTYLQSGVLTILGRKIALPSYPYPNQLIDGASYGLPGITVTLNEQVASLSRAGTDTTTAGLFQGVSRAVTGRAVIGIHVRMDVETNGTEIVGEVMFAASESVMECGRSDMSISGVAEPSPAVVDEVMTYTFSVANPGPDVMRDVTVTDSLPPDMSLVGVSATHGGVCSVIGVDITCDWSALEAGQATQIQIRAIPLVETTYTNTAILTTTDTDTNMTNNESTVIMSASVAAPSEADLSLSLNVPASADTDTVVAISGRVANTGPTDATGVRAYLSLPVTVQQLQADSGGVCAYQNPNEYLCEWASLAVGLSAGFSADVVFTATGTTTLSAQASANEPDANLVNNQASQAVTVQQSNTVPDLVLTLQATPDNAAPGEPVVFSLTVDNIGGASATNVIVIDELSEDMDLDNLTPSSGGVCSVDYPQVRCAWPEVTAAGSANVMMNTTVILDAQDSNIGNDAWVYADDICPEGGAPCDITYTTVILNY